MPQEYIYSKKFQEGVHFEQEAQFAEPPHSLKDAVDPDHLVRLSQLGGGGGGGGGALNDLTDVTIAAPAVGQVLKYNGLEWVNNTDEEGAASPLSVGYAANSGVVAAGDTIESGVGKLDGNISNLQTQVGNIQSGNNLFNYYNFY